MKDVKYKRLLVISHNCFSKTGSNGRTLMNYLKGWPLDKIAQFYIHPQKPDFDICKNYYCMSDRDVLISSFKNKSAGKVVTQEMTEQINYINNNRIKKEKLKNSIVFLAREMIWNLKFWNNKEFEQWLNTFKPEIILFQAGDSGFLFRIAKRIKEKYGAKLVMYNTEGYYFKSKSYLVETKFSNFFYPILHYYFCKEYKKFMNACEMSIYNCTSLRDDYEACISHNNDVIMASSEFTNEELSSNQKKEHHIVYAGNIGLGRHESIIEFAKAVWEIDKNLYIDIYTQISDENIKRQLENSPGIRLHQFVAYKKLQKIILNSEYLLHIENFSEFYRDDLKYAFSTKIADSLASGNCLIIYAPEEIAICRYLTDKDAAVLITSKKELKKKLNQLLSNKDYQHQLKNNGRVLALKNHDILTNRDKFHKKIMEVVDYENITG